MEDLMQIIYSKIGILISVSHRGGKQLKQSIKRDSITATALIK